MEEAILVGHENIFTLLNNNKEHNKVQDDQLTTANRMIKDYYESSFAAEKGAGGEGEARV